jgi:hypothetical protein
LVNKSEPYIIDFAGYTFGDPWREFYISFWIRDAFPYYLAGFINGYFNDLISELFFPTLLLYNSISLLKDSINRRVDEEAAFFLKCHENMNNSVPVWYRTHYTKQAFSVDSVR